MEKDELIKKLEGFLQEINEMLSLGDLGLLKSNEMYTTKYRIEDELKILKTEFDKIESLKIEKAIPMWRNAFKSNIFLQQGQANKEIQDLHVLLQELINVKGGSAKIEVVTPPMLDISGHAINQAINDAKTLLSNEGAPSAVDRMHTVLHGYLKQICKDANIAFSDDATLNQLVKILKEKHPKISSRTQEVDQILQSMANVLDKLNPIRNNQSLAHANQDILSQDEAMFVINTINTLLAYFQAKLEK